MPFALANGGVSVGQAYRVLQASFATRHALDREYEANLANGGLFIPGRLSLLYDEPVVVLVDLPFAETAVELEGRVVQTIPAEFEENGGRAGVAIELADPPDVVRDRLEEAIGAPMLDERESGEGQRYAKRSVAHVRAQVRVPGVAELEGETRNLSLAGVLVAIDGEAPPVGQDVVVAIVHPTTGEDREIPGLIARHELDAEGGVCGLGIQFAVEPERADETLAYLAQVKASEHARRLGGITGSIATLGLEDLVSSFGRCVPSGRFTLMNAGQVGTIYVADGLLVSAQMGAAVGIKALVRMACWRDGNFEFHANEPIEEGEQASVGLPIDAALLEAARFMDESRARRGVTLPRRAGLRVDHREVDLDDPNLSKTESRILDLAGVGMTVSRLLDTIQEPDALVEEAILGLVENGALRMEEPA